MDKIEFDNIMAKYAIKKVDADSQLIEYVPTRSLVKLIDIRTGERVTQKTVEDTIQVKQPRTSATRGRPRANYAGLKPKEIVTPFGRFISVKEAARVSGMSTALIYKRCRENENKEVKEYYYD